MCLSHIFIFHQPLAQGRRQPAAGAPAPPYLSSDHFSPCLCNTVHSLPASPSLSRARGRPPPPPPPPSPFTRVSLLHLLPPPSALRARLALNSPADAPAGCALPKSRGPPAPPASTSFFLPTWRTLVAVRCASLAPPSDRLSPPPFPRCCAMVAAAIHSCAFPHPPLSSRPLRRASLPCAPAPQSPPPPPKPSVPCPHACTHVPPRARYGAHRHANNITRETRVSLSFSVFCLSSETLVRSRQRHAAGASRQRARVLPRRGTVTECSERGWLLAHTASGFWCLWHALC